MQTPQQNDDYKKYIDVTKKVMIYDGSPAIIFQRSDTVNLITAGEHYFPQFFRTQHILQIQQLQ